MNYGAGDVELGLTATWRTVWEGSVTFTHFFGPPDRQPFADRDFISISIPANVLNGSEPRKSVRWRAILHLRPPCVPSEKTSGYRLTASASMTSWTSSLTNPDHIIRVSPKSERLRVAVASKPTRYGCIGSPDPRPPLKVTFRFDGSADIRNRQIACNYAGIFARPRGPGLAEAGEGVTYRLERSTSAFLSSSGTCVSIVRMSTWTVSVLFSGAD